MLVLSKLRPGRKNKFRVAPVSTFEQGQLLVSEQVEVKRPHSAWQPANETWQSIRRHRSTQPTGFCAIGRPVWSWPHVERFKARKIPTTAIKPENSRRASWAGPNSAKSAVVNLLYISGSPCPIDCPMSLNLSVSPIFRRAEEQVKQLRH